MQSVAIGRTAGEPGTSATNGEAIVDVTYRGSAGDRFDRSYYMEHHLKLVMAAWAPHGLVSAAAFFPAIEADGTAAICKCRFRDEDAVAACLAVPATAAVMADVANFTALPPLWLTAQPDGAAAEA